MLLQAADTLLTRAGQLIKINLWSEKVPDLLPSLPQQRPWLLCLETLPSITGCPFSPSFRAICRKTPGLGYEQEKKFFISPPPPFCSFPWCLSSESSQAELSACSSGTHQAAEELGPTGEKLPRKALLESLIDRNPSKSSLCLNTIP